MKSWILKVFLFILSATVSFNSLGAEPKAVKGVLDLRNIDHPQQFVSSLNGEWEFYWKKMLRPHNFLIAERPVPDCYGEVPSYWTAYRSGSVITQKYGYATYHLTVLLPRGINRYLSVMVPVFDSSYDLYINGEYRCSNGIPGMSENETTPEYSPKVVSFQPVSDTVSIIINVSNYHHRRGGFWLPMKLGTSPEINRNLEYAKQIDWATISLLLGFSVFFLFFFFIYPKEKILVYFSLAVIGLAIRPFFTSHFLIHGIITPGWTWLIRLEYLNLFQIFLGWTWFSATLYPSKFIRWFAWIITGTLLCATVVTVALPVTIFSYSIILLHLLILGLIIYLFYSGIKGMIKKNSVDFVYFFAFLLFVIFLIHDIKVSMGESKIPLGYSLSIVVVFFIFIQAALLLYKWVREFHEKEKIQNDLEFMNRNLELIVYERTQEIIKRNEEIEKQSYQINEQNKRLSETILLKNKIFSVIAHDLRSPVVNILYMLNLLKEEEYKAKYETFANSCINYSQMVINLLENMLVWGKGQEDKIKFSPASHNLADVILTNLSIMKETADRKDIQVNFTQAGNPYAYFDKALIDIVVRNLMSNAVKYTERGGRISILMKNNPSNKKGVMIKICDNGIGISVERQKNLFSNSEVDSTPGTENEKGTGLGLKLCYELVSLNNGTISVSGKEGEGVCFTIILPSGSL